MSNAHAKTTPHRIGQQAKAQLLIADAFERDRAATTRPDPHELATWLLEQLQTLGWAAPPDPNADIPPLRPDHAAGEDSPGRQQFRATLCDRYGHPDPTADTCPRCGETRRHD